MDDAQLARRFETLEAQVKLLSDHLGLSSPRFPGSVAASPPTDSTSAPAATSGQVPDEVLELARAGKTTQAISLYRRLTGTTLLEAKQIVESL
jgi:ribosomal protein L7/L12